MAQLEVEYADGSAQTILTDNTWKTTGAGPIQEADFLMGEFYDARKEMPGWTQAGFDDSAWESALRAEETGKVPATFYEFVNPGPGEDLAVKGRPVDLGFKRPPVLQAFPGRAGARHRRNQAHRHHFAHQRRLHLQPRPELRRRGPA